MARPRKPSGELLDQRVQVMMSKSELDLIDDWSFANRIRSRGEAIRRLVVTGMVSNLKEMKEARLVKIAHEE